MLKAYLQSIVIFAIIILCIGKIFKRDIQENGWVEGTKKADIDRYMALFILSAVPIFRLFVIWAIFHMAFTKKSD